jgi:hypothetical protein
VTVTAEQRIAALERSVREIAETVAATVRTREAHERMAAVVARHADEEPDEAPLDP